MREAFLLLALECIVRCKERRSTLEILTSDSNRAERTVREELWKTGIACSGTYVLRFNVSFHFAIFESRILGTGPQMPMRWNSIQCCLQGLI